MKAKNIGKTILLVAAIAAFTACSNDEQLQEITLTTPVLTLADASAQAVLSKAGVGDVAIEEVNSISLFPRLTRGMGKETVGNLGSYQYNADTWSSDDALTVTSGPGAYHAAANALVSLNAKEGERPAIDNIYYTWQGNLLAREDGTFELDGAMTPRTAAIWVKLKDANGNDITEASELEDYNISYTGVDFRDINYTEGSEGTYSYEFMAIDIEPALTANLHYGYWYPATYGTAGGSWELFSIKHNGATYPVYYTGELTLEAGKLYTFTVQLNRDKQATIVGGISVSDFATGHEINIER